MKKQLNVEVHAKGDKKLKKQEDLTCPLQKSDLQQRIHELEANLFELQKQNEKLEQDRAEAEAAYRQYTDLYDFAPVSYFTLSRDGNILEVNLAGANLLGVEREKLIGSKLGSFVSAESSSTFKDFFDRLLSGTGKETCELTFGKNEPDLLWVRIEATCFDGGHTCRAVMLSISERKRAENELRITMTKYKSLFESFPLGISISDEAGNVLEANSTSEKLLGVPQEEHMLRNIEGPEWKIVRPDGSPMPPEEFASVRALREKVRVENVEMGIVKPNAITWINVTASPLPLKGYGVVVAFGDITERKRTTSLLDARIRVSEFADTHSLDEVLQKALDEAEALTGSQIGFAHFLKEDQKTLHLQTWSTNTLMNMCTAEGKGSHYPVEQAGVWAECIATREPVVHNDYPGLPASRRKGLPQGHAPVQRELVIPVLRNNLVTMIMGVGNKPFEYDQNDVEAVSQLAGSVWDIVQRKQAEEAVRETQELLSLFIKHSPIYTFIKEVTPTESRVLQASNNFHEMIGIEGAAMAGKTMQELFPPDLAAKMTADDWDVVAKGQTLELDETLNGHYYNTLKFPLTVGDKTLLAGYTIDITERKKAEEERREANSYNRRLIEASIDPLVTIGPDGKITDVNEATETVTGLSRGQLIGEDFLNYFTEPNKAREGYQKALAEGIAKDVPLTIQHVHGKTTDVLFNASVYKNEAGEVQGIFAAARDITERKHAEEALRASELFIKGILNSITAHIAVLDGQGVIVAVNEAWKKFARENEGSDSKGYLGTNYFAVCEASIQMGDLVAFQVAQAIHAVMNGSQDQFSMEYPCHSPTQPRWFTITVVPQQKPHQGVIVIHQDITERKQAEQALAAANRELQTALLREKELARTDVLTGVNNRRHLYQQAEHEFQVAIRYQQPLSVIMFDIDLFKKVNDTFGHEAGDQILKLVTDTAKTELRSPDVIGRYGGEEFIIILPVTNAQQAFQLAERIRLNVENMHIPTPKGVAHVTLSIGIVELNESSDGNVEEIFRRADEAMYAAKQAGRNRTETR